MNFCTFRWERSRFTFGERYIFGLRSFISQMEYSKWSDISLHGISFRCWPNISTNIYVAMHMASLWVLSYVKNRINPATNHQLFGDFMVIWTSELDMMDGLSIIWIHPMWIDTVVNNKYHPGGHNWDYLGALSWSPINGTPLKFEDRTPCPIFKWVIKTW